MGVSRVVLLQGVVSFDERGDGDAGARQREHWEEVDLFLEMWHEIARAWGNETLLRLARYARLEVEAERLLLAQSAERAANAPRSGGEDAPTGSLPHANGSVRDEEKAGVEPASGAHKERMLRYSDSKAVPPAGEAAGREQPEGVWAYHRRPPQTP